LFTVIVETAFTAAHQLVLQDGSKEPFHRHSWTVTAEVSSERLNRLGLVMDFRRLKALLEGVIKPFDGGVLNKMKYFEQNNCSAEIVAQYIYEKLQPELPERLRLESITVIEEPGTAARYSRHGAVP